MAIDYNDWPGEEDATFEEYIHDEPYVKPLFDESVLAQEQK